MFAHVMFGVLAVVAGWGVLGGIKMVNQVERGASSVSAEAEPGRRCASRDLRSSSPSSTG